jgi:hypothetical protein
MMFVESAIHWKTSEFLIKQKTVSYQGNKRWVSEDGTRYFEWDSLHGEIEVYDKKGNALMVLNPNGSYKDKKIKKGRTIDV